MEYFNLFNMSKEKKSYLIYKYFNELNYSHIICKKVIF